VRSDAGSAIAAGTVVLDVDALGALRDPEHPRHGLVLAHLRAVAARQRRGSDVRLVVPTTARVAAGWDRSNPVTAIERIPVEDHPLTGESADAAATILEGWRGSVADAHIGALLRELTGAAVPRQAIGAVLVVTGHLPATASPTA
jgi:hypothetical protein